MTLVIWAILGFIGMEGFSWAFHKYVMHGPLWAIHRTHHEPHSGYWEMNDLFSLVFGLAAAWAIYEGMASGQLALAGAGFGVTAYGLLYFLLHDLAIHNRARSRFWSRISGIDRIRRAHKIHHKYRSAKPGKSFGLFYVSESVFKRGEEQ